MPLYRCDNCGCVENTAFGNYWSKDNAKVWPAEYLGKALCSECGPPAYVDGTKTQYGKWHGRFKKRSADGMLIDQNGHLWPREHFRIVGGSGAEGVRVEGDSNGAF